MPILRFIFCLVAVAAFACTSRANEPTTTAPRTPPVLPAPASLQITPAEVTIHGGQAIQRLVVTGKAADPTFQHDYSRVAIYKSSKPEIATVTADGVITPLAN